ncbi:MAG: InlB B-repeat-containing protein, partial [Candidatus Bathyarchaeota archaeon]|uniref:DUF6273 domain-containing protein n=1 Tax=Candidatus Bathycorpusculum sp. TaxID=2994959 RepID=UPI0028173A66|nr:InlB B-repeat-containing protein [Candidatus Termiticorpusculum sp.]MCL2257652.1 InlB B-repeat-containing protein [Candidatus Termiticorpusculum sp.]
MSNVLFNSKSSKIKKVLFLVLTFALLSMLFLPVQESFAAPITDTPTGVNGRVLSASMTGDTSDWIEIAKNGDYSLIVRKVVLSGGVAFNSNYDNNYMNSFVRNTVNNWFNNVLSSTARLRGYTVVNDATQKRGSCFSVSNNGYSKPSTVTARTGNDVAFCLSYAEAASFCSTRHALGSTTNVIQSSSIARSNFYKLTSPSAGGSQRYWWLRTAGNSATTATSVGLTFENEEGCAYASTVLAQYYARPALWVSSAVFETAPTSYSISYNLAGGVNAIGNPTSYIVSALPLTIATPYRSGYNFSNWRATCANGTEVILQNGVIPRGTTGNLVLTASWNIVQYAISYVLQGGTNAASNPTMYNVENAHLLSIS